MCLRLLGASLCPWTLMGTSVPQIPSFVPRIKFLATPLIIWTRINVISGYNILGYLDYKCEARILISFTATQSFSVR